MYIIRKYFIFERCLNDFLMDFNNIIKELLKLINGFDNVIVVYCSYFICYRYLLNGLEMEVNFLLGFLSLIYEV